MKRLKSLPGFYLEVVIFALMAVDKQKGGQLFLSAKTCTDHRTGVSETTTNFR